MNTSNICPKCQAPMAEGFILDEAHSARVVARWVAGKPERSLWSGTKVKGREQHLIHTFRCTECGFLESYAGKQPDPPVA